MGIWDIYETNHGDPWFMEPIPWDPPQPQCYRSTAADALDQVLAEDLEDSPEKNAVTWRAADGMIHGI